MLLNQKQIRALEQLRDTLLPKLMSRKVRVVVPPSPVEVNPNGLFERLGVYQFPDDNRITVNYHNINNGAVPSPTIAMMETLWRLEQEPSAPIVGKTINQKINYVLDRQGANSGASYKRGDHGPYSDEVDETLQNLESLGWVALRKQRGRQLVEITTQPEYALLRRDLLPTMAPYEQIIQRTVELFKRIKNTIHAEEVGTILFAADHLKHYLRQNLIPKQEIIGYVTEWKAHWNKPGKLKKVDDAINLLVEMGFILTD